MPDSIESLVGDLTSDDRTVRTEAQDALVALGSAAVEHVLPLLDDRRTAGELEGIAFFRRAADSAVPRLQEIRRRGPGRLRRAALRALAEVRGEEGLESRDRQAVERLVRIKLLREKQERVTLPRETRWLAFPADRLEGAVAALGLHDLRPATCAMGVAATTVAKDAIENETPDGGKVVAYRAFITPEFKGWRLVYGDSFLDAAGGPELAERISERCGEGHFYSIDTYHNANVWWIAENGRVVRGHSTYADPEWVGEPLPFELTYIEADADDPFLDRDLVERYSEGVTDPDMVALKLSVEPRRMRPATMRGHGWLATTHPAVPSGAFRGALPI
ncbi:hypothetical protein AR457_31380 [Streptomyces agglomeratus]|uniref:hypothetical protein n=1 Tax=Streptomyces agglomeratus TaxID=285458 RepID=UPI00085267F8|nr:hypothetical protein [Streptomyces agglomeratus]OEJ37634.1 hypothetical protein BGK70_05265 [Streptomyces agglomeratus]OEJ47979.1 hypothetical protein AR457_31380 [Streptomyces agglomeratus]OEJ50173.1 hypothetical protein BGK72_04780 [Streptomyces agglomeratus]OEJ57502.1 hypothetical protein BGM19_05460 [Streptomyces agglomeratus]